MKLPGAVIVIAVFASALVLYASTASRLQPIVFYNIDSVYYADTADIVRFLKHGGDEGFAERDPCNAPRHIMVRPLAALVFQAITSTTEFEENDAIIALMALIAALNVSLAYGLARRLGGGVGVAVALASLYALAFSNLVYFSVPETIAWSCLGLLLFFHVLIRAEQSDSTERWVLPLAFSVAVAGWFNVALLSLLVPTAWLFCRRFELPRLLLWGLVAGAATVVVFAAPYFIVESRPFFESAVTTFDDVGASPRRLVESNALASVAASFFAFSVVSPVSELGPSINYSDAGGLMRFPAIVVATLGTVAGLSSLWHVLRYRGDVAVGSIIWVLFIFAFFTAFAPGQAIIFSVFVVPAMLILLHPVFRNWMRNGVGIIALVLFLILLAATNLTPLYSMSVPPGTATSYNPSPSERCGED